MKNVYLITLGLLSLLVFQNCGSVEVEVNTNNGFLAYSSGIGITEGISITSYQEGGIDIGYILLGSTDTGFEKDYFIVKTDNDGNVLKNKVYTGDSNVDNIPVQVIVNDSLIYVLGNRFDRVVNRVLSYIAVYNLSDLSDLSVSNDPRRGRIYLDVIREEDNVYEEQGVGFFIDESIIYVATTLIYEDNTAAAYVYSINLENNKYKAKKSSISLADSSCNINPRAIKKGENGFYVMGDILLLDPHENLSGKGYFIEKYDMGLDVQSTYVNQNFAEFSTVLDFEEVNDGELIVFYRTGIQASLELIQLTDSIDVIYINNIGEVSAKDTITYDGYPTFIIDDSKSSFIQKINGDYIITGIDVSNELFVNRLNVDTSIPKVELKWETPWRVYNNTTFLNHERNTVGKAILNNSKNGYAIIGTHDFINTTKMILIQLDENGNYY